MSGRHISPRSGSKDQILTAALVLALLAVMALGYGLIDNRWYRVVSVEGGSMQPSIRPGDAIVLVRPPERLSVGDVVTLQANDTLVTHRVVEVATDGSFATQGDANQTADDWTGVDIHVVGRVALTIPRLGSLLEVFGTNAFFNDRSSRHADAAAGTWESVASSVAPIGKSPIGDSTNVDGSGP